MPFFKSLPAESGPPAIFKTFPELYGAWAEMSQLMMNGASPLSQGERELILAYAAAASGCKFVYAAHSEVAYAWGIENGLIEKLLADFDNTPVEPPRLKPLLAFVRKLSSRSGEMTQADADAVFDAGWDEHALHDAIAVTARAAFMQRLVEGYGFTPLTREAAIKRAKERIEHGYVNLYKAFRKPA